MESPLIVTSEAPTTISTLYTTGEVATLLKVSQRTVQDWIRSGTLTAIRYGRLLRVRQVDLEAFGVGAGPRTSPVETAAAAPE